jgi:hypothetical protein
VEAGAVNASVPKGLATSANMMGSSHSSGSHYEPC